MTHHPVAACISMVTLQTQPRDVIMVGSARLRIDTTHCTLTPTQTVCYIYIYPAWNVVCQVWYMTCRRDRVFPYAYIPVWKRNMSVPPYFLIWMMCQVPWQRGGFSQEVMVKPVLRIRREPFPAFKRCCFGGMLILTTNSNRTQWQISRCGQGCAAKIWVEQSIPT